MKKFFMMLVMFVSVLTIKAQMVYDVNYGAMEFQVGNAWYSCADVPGCTHISRGDNVMTVVTNYFTRLRHDNPEAYVREYNAWTMRGGLAGVQPVRYSTATNGMMMGGIGMNGGMMMGGMGYGMQNTGMVMGATGMAGATSNVVIDNSNLAETIGSGITMNYDTGSNSLSISGDPITAGLRLFTAIGSKTKKSNRQAQQVVYQQQMQQPVQQQTYNGYVNGQVLQDAQGNQYIVQNGQLYRLQSQQVQQPQQVRTQSQQVRTNTTTTRTNGSDFVTGF